MTNNTKIALGLTALAVGYFIYRRRQNQSSTDVNFSNLTETQDNENECRKKCGIPLKKNIPFFSLEKLFSLFSSEKLTTKQQVCLKLCKTPKIIGASPTGLSLIGGEFEAGLGLFQGAKFYGKEVGKEVGKHYAIEKTEEHFKLHW